ncbi:FkbM family methyltransferase [Methanocorpusculum vombati]|uniref:FkbM family methyltransferase n=1 Tax=Methanocorpusculum vombati TaxID=3002864 RepID=A0ABT4IJU3_9EURY|nr:FkbM family methyltransferase [Methanocorpusculum vombati]MCZ9319534.1 FkbM family methyltransferase [Methanocorpusculum sp.]MCZ0861826.1 FkbM family methyltransferase [Methanocorpusculum vombati]MDE2521204.1 FkbM family methyltransferase [Methanocorpusculum sp.]MDE2534941.1 FkbM family methyltransferase [Methanocorpusculum sp.]MDE2545489.1 FkbM family methyltransferase [Methanocorpusculum sp.]
METMNHKIVNFGKRVIPDALLPTIQKYYNKHYYDRPTIQKIIAAYSDSNDTEIQNIVKYISRNGLIAFPYEWADRFTPQNRKKINSIQIFKDKEYDLPYVYLGEEKLYFPNDWDDQKIRINYFGLQEIEQHLLSPHCYLSEDFVVDENSIVVDCGVAEGNFSLSIVEKCKKLYLFEPEEQWMEPLKATFAPWKDKVVIVQKYLSDITDEVNITLDDYFADKEYPNFLKLDVEGYEKQVLLGSKKILSSDDLKKVVTCIYHKADDEDVLGALLCNHGFITSKTPGYTTLSLDNKYPYLRHGVIRATKSS